MNRHALLLATLSLLALVAAPARADDLQAAAEKAAVSLGEQIARKLGHAPVAVALAPAKETAAAQQGGAARAFTARLGAELARTGKLKVLDWQALDQVAREKLLGAVNGGALSLPPVANAEVLIVSEATADDRGVRVSLRAVALPAGNVVAAETARLAAKLPGLAGSDGVDVVVRRVSDMLSVGLSRLPGNGRYQRLAVLPLQDVGPEAKKRELGAVVAAELSTDLRQYHGLLLVERARLGSILAEVKLGEMGLVDPKDAPRLGKLADAQALVVGSVSDAGDRFLVNVRVVATETAETLATASESVAAASLIALSSDAVVLRSRQDAVFRSLLVPGWGQVYNRQKVKGAVFGGAAAVALGSALAFHLQATKAADDYDRKVTAGQLGGDPAGAAAALRQKADTAFLRRNAFLWGAAGVWAVGAVDAYLFGVDGERAADGLALAPAAPADGEGLGLALAWRF